MKKKVWHCDRCGTEINVAPKSFLYMDHNGRPEFDRVHVEHYSVRYGVYMGCSICEKCKIEVLEKALKKLKESKEQSK